MSVGDDAHRGKMKAMAKAIQERIHFRLIQMPCCNHLFCNVNPRLPSYCPACGKSVYSRLREGEGVLISDNNAWIRYTPGPLREAVG